MFTGIIEELGKIVSLQSSRGPAVLEIYALKVSKTLNPGDSVSVNGACLTAIKISVDSFQVEVSRETFARTNLEELKPGDFVNLERPLTLSDRLGGHLVLGHVDGKGTLQQIAKKEGNTILVFSIPKELSRYVVDKGSVAIDGISLTPFDVKANTFSVSVIPHTLENTTFKYRKPGSLVNVEVDILAKYLESLFRDRDPSKPSNLSKEFLKKHGFA